MALVKTLAVLGLVLAGSLFSDAKVLGLRTWTSDTNQEIEATLVRAFKKEKGGALMVTLKLTSGKRATLPATRFSEADRKQLAEWLARNPLGVAPPAPPYRWPSIYNGTNSPKVDYAGYREERKAHLFRARHFDFYCDERLSDATVSKCVAVFDNIVEAIDSLPMMMDSVPSEGSPRYEAVMVADKAKYMKMGGLPNSAGFFSRRMNRTIIPFESLGIVKKGTNWVFDGKRRYFGTLVHELTHHATSHWRGMPPWFEEGLADYMQAMPYRSGRFLFTSPGSAVAASIRNYEETTVGSGVIPDGNLLMVHPRDLFLLDRPTWNQTMQNEVAAARNYASSAVLVYFFMHEDGRGDGAHFIQWMHAWRSAVFSRRALEYGALIAKHLVRGRSDAELEAEIAEAMSKRGLRIKFAD